MDGQFCIIHEEDIKDLRAEMAANNKEHESFRRRLHEHDEQINEIHQLTTAVGKLADGIAETKRTVDKIDKRVEAIEKEPAEKWKKITFEVVKTVVVLLVGAALAYFGVK